MSLFDDFVEHAGNTDGLGGGRLGGTTSISHGGPSVGSLQYEGFEDDGYDDEDDDEAGDGNYEGTIEALETGYIPTSLTLNDLPIFTLGRVQFTLPSKLLSLVVTNNILIMALYPLTIIIIDLSNPSDLINIDLPNHSPSAPSSNNSSRPYNKLSRGGSSSINEGNGAVPQIHKIFPDPTSGKVLLVTTTAGETYYLASSGPANGWTKKPKQLRSLKFLIDSVFWGPPTTGSTSSSTTSTTRECLIGGKNGSIYYLQLATSDFSSSEPEAQQNIFKTQAGQLITGATQGLMTGGPEKDFQLVFTLPEKEPVVGLGFGFISSSTSGASKSSLTGWVVATTKNNIYQFWGNVGNSGSAKERWTDEIFKPYRGGEAGGGQPLNFDVVSGQPIAPQLLFALPPLLTPSSSETTYSSLPSSPASKTSLAWLTSQGIYNATVMLPPPNPTSSEVAKLLNSPSIMKFPSGGNSAGKQPIAITLSEYHYLVLWEEGRICAVGRLDEKIVWDEKIPLRTDEKPIGLSSDASKRTCWLYTDSSIYEIVIKDEDRNVWSVSLVNGQFEDALKFARTPAQKDLILSSQADAFFAKGRFHQAAQKYALCSKSFEHVVLKFVDAGERDAMRYYLTARLDGLGKGDITQRMMLATWLVEIYLSKCNTLEDMVAAEAARQDVESLKLERTLVEEEMRQFLADYQANLDKKTVYNLFLSHGRTDLYIHFATIVKDHGVVVEHWIMEERWLKAIAILNRQNSLDLYYRFSSVLMRNAPKETVDCWMRQSALDPKRLIPALLQQRHRQRDPLEPNHAIRYLNHVIFNKENTDATVHNLLVTFHCSDPNPDDGPLLRFLASSPDNPETDRPYYDLDYALRLCKQHNRVQPCVMIYSKMGLYESSVNLALEKGDIELAKANADKPTDDEPLRKKLWLKIAKYVVQDKKDIKSAMRFLEATDLLNIEDILPFFPDFVVIDEFKEEICTALEAAGAHIQALKIEMDDATRAAEDIKRDIAQLDQRFITIEQDDICVRCELPLLSRQFYAFPCLHSFHADCLISQVKEYLPAATLRRILTLQTLLLKGLSTTNGSKTHLHNHQNGASSPATGIAPSKRALLSSSLLPSRPTSVSSLLPGGKQLVAAGDRLRELIIPDALASAVGVGTTRKKDKSGGGISKADEARMEEIRGELDELLASKCPLCEGLVVGVDKSFGDAIGDGEDETDWAI